MSRLSGTVEKVFDRRKGTSDAGKKWSVQRFKLDTGDEDVTCEAWGMRDLADMEGERVTVTGKPITEKYEGKTYDKFKLDEPPQVEGDRRRRDDDDDDHHQEPRHRRVDDDEPPRRERRRDPDPTPERDSWKVHLMRATNLLAKCHEAAKSMGLEDGEDARTLFIQSKHYIKDMPARPMDKEPEPEQGHPGADAPPDDDDVPF